MQIHSHAQLHITKLFFSFHIQMRQRQDMDEVCYEKVVEFVRAGHQVMVFVHARNATVNTAMVLKETAQQVGGEISGDPPDISGLF